MFFRTQRDWLTEKNRSQFGANTEGVELSKKKENPKCYLRIANFSQEGKAPGVAGRTDKKEESLALAGRSDWYTVPFKKKSP